MARRMAGVGRGTVSLRRSMGLFMLGGDDGWRRGLRQDARARVPTPLEKEFGHDFVGDGEASGLQTKHVAIKDYSAGVYQVRDSRTEVHAIVALDATQVDAVQQPEAQKNLLF